MRLYGKYLRMLLKCRMQYRASFWLQIVSQFLISSMGLLSVWFLFDRFRQVEGFSFREVLICYAVVLMAFALAECFARGFDVFPRLIKSGDLDRILVRPRAVALQVLASNAEFSRLGRLAQAALVLAYAVPNCGVVWTTGKVFVLMGMIVGGVVVFSSLFILYAGISFFTIEGLEFMNIFTDGGREFGQYPLAVYGDGVLKVLTYAVPLALFQYYPFLYLVGRTDRWWYGLLPFVGCLFAVPCYLFFRFGLRKYRSAGS